MLVLLLALAIVLGDQVTKLMVRTHFEHLESRVVIDGFFHLTYIRNPGAAWGLFGGQSTGLIVLSIVVLVMLVLFRRRFLTNTLEHRLALGLMVGGIVGNLVDRIRDGRVVDFLDFHVRGSHFPAFNVADMAICLGVGIYILSSFWLREHPLRENGKDDKGGSPTVEPPRGLDGHDAVGL